MFRVRVHIFIVVVFLHLQIFLRAPKRCKSLFIVEISKIN